MTPETFLHMGGYGLYVWSAYGLGLVVLAANFLWPWWRQRRLLRHLVSEDGRRPEAKR